VSATFGYPPAKPYNHVLVILEAGSVWVVMNVSISLEIRLGGFSNFKFLGDKFVNEVRLTFTDNILDSTIYIAGSPRFFNPLAGGMLKFKYILREMVVHRIVFLFRVLLLIV
jgi:hypothetical protein